MNKNWLFLALIAPFLLPGCGGENGVESSRPYVKPPVIKAAEPVKKVERVKYVYSGDKYRDPFVALLTEAPQTTTNGIAAPSLGALTLKGIFEDGGVPVAMISANGSSYFLRGKQLFDSRRRLIRGYTGVIRADSVLMIAPDRTTKELKLREK